MPCVVYFWPCAQRTLSSETPSTSFTRLFYLVARDFYGRFHSRARGGLIQVSYLEHQFHRQIPTAEALILVRTGAAALAAGTVLGHLGLVLLRWSRWRRLLLLWSLVLLRTEQRR